MKKQTSQNLLYNPTLGSVLMVEEAIYKHSQECGKYQLWKILPRKIMYQSYLVILNYLEMSNKIIIDKDGCITWVYNTKRVKSILSKNLVK